MEELDEDEWLEHLEEHLKEIVHISGKDERTIAAHFEAHRREVYERIAREHPELAERFQERRHMMDEHMKEKIRKFMPLLSVCERKSDRNNVLLNRPCGYRILFY